MRTRFAPSPTGLLHVGNVYSALACEAWAKEHSAGMILRIEDIDFTRCKPELTLQMIDDLKWLELRFDGDTTYQQNRLSLYQEALDTFIKMGVLYPCFCTRKQIQAQTRLNEVEALDDYPKTCLRLTTEQQKKRVKQTLFSWRLDSCKVQEMLGNDLFWQDTNGQQYHFSLADIGDVIIGRKDINFSYHLAVVVDDEAQKITHIIRGEDLRESTPVHHVLQKLLGYQHPLYHHHKLIKDEQGERLAKTKQSITLKSLRDKGLSVSEVRESIKKGASIS
jgi:glutamyl-Q tRNA(Asp) synthetase